MTRPITHYPSSPADRARETEQVIATVRATIAPAEQAQTLRDLKRGADGEPQLDEAMLEDAAVVASVLSAIFSDEDGMGGTWEDEDIERVILPALAAARSHAYAAAAKHCHEQADREEGESAMAAHVLREASKAIAKMGGGS